jgi:hypothetical protein
MQTVAKKMRGMLPIAVFLLLPVTNGAAQSVPADRQLKQGEFEPYNDAVNDITGGKFSKAIIDLDTWAQKFQDSEYANERLVLYVQAYAGANQPAKSIDAASKLLARDLSLLFPEPAGRATTIRLLYGATWAISHIADPTPQQLAAGDNAAHQLLEYDREPAGLTPAQWAEARADMKEKSTAALLYMAMLPGVHAMTRQPPDCTAAESAYAKALGAYPDKAVLSYELGRALNCEAKQEPVKFPAAIYQFQRAAVIDPTLGDSRNDPKKIQAFADNAYVKFHGSNEGLDRLKQQVKQSPFTPADFKIRSAQEIAEDTNNVFEKEHPQLALWMKIRQALLDGDGEQYFENGLKDAALPELVGKLIEARPACNPRELLIAVPVPDNQKAGGAEIALKLDKELIGKPDLDAELRWEGVPSAFTRDPFLLTMDAETVKVQGVRLTPCAASPSRKGASGAKR